MKEISLEEEKIFGFWLYLMTDLVIFAVLFAAFLVLRHNTFGGPSASELFDMSFVLLETLLLLTSSFTCSLATYAMHQEKPRLVLFWFGLTFLLGLGFLLCELHEFSELLSIGAGPQRSGFLSSFFTLVGTHGLHIAIGLLWILIAMVRVGWRPLTHHSTSQLMRLAFFWHFLDVVWVFIFSVVYGVGYIK